MTPQQRTTETDAAPHTGAPAPTDPHADTVDDIDALADPRWDALVSAHPTSVFHSPGWLRVLAATYGFPVRARLLTDGTGAPSAGMAYVTVTDFMDTRIVSLPFSDFCDPVAAGPSEWHRLVDGVVAQRCRIDLRCLHNDLPVADPRFMVTDRALWHAIDVHPDEDEMWRTLPGPARRALRKAQSSNVSVKTGRTESDMRTFYELHLRVRRYKYGLLAQPYRFFSQIWHQLVAPGHGVLLLVTIDDRVVGGVVFLEWQGVLYYKFNASDQDHLAARPNDRVLWEGLRYAREHGLGRIDLGLTDADQEGLVRYKRKYATHEKPITLLRHQPPGHPTSRDRRAREMLGDVTRLLTDPSVPDELCERAGDALYRYFA